MASDRLLRQQISELKKLERQCFASRNRFAFYLYLAAVYEFYVELKQANGIANSVRQMAKLFNLDGRQHAHPIRVIIDASSDAGNKKLKTAGFGRYGLPGANANAGVIWKPSCGKTVDRRAVRASSPLCIREHKAAV